MSRQESNRIALSAVLCNVRSGEDRLRICAVGGDINDRTEGGRYKTLLRVKATPDCLFDASMATGCSLTLWHLPALPYRSDLSEARYALREAWRCIDRSGVR